VFRVFKTKVSPVTAAAHGTAIDSLVGAETPAGLGAALEAFRDLRSGAAPGTAPGVPWDAEDRHYCNGYHLFTKVGDELAATAINMLPPRTLGLWAALDQLHREQTENQDLSRGGEDGPGQPSIGRPTPIRLPEWLIKILDNEANAEGISRARHVRNLILEARAARTARQSR
jgi:hypothetical protein